MTNPAHLSGLMPSGQIYQDVTISIHLPGLAKTIF